MGYREGIQYPYTGPRTEEGIVNWVQERQGPFVRESQCSDIEGATAKAVFFTSLSASKNEYEIFEKASKS